jgi:hypothetical protein
MRHLVVLAAALASVVLVGVLTLALGRAAAVDSDRVTAIFAPGTSPALMMATVAAADGRLIRGTILPFAVEVAGEAPGIAARLAANGALAVVAKLPGDMLAVGGCSYLAPEAYPGAEARLRTAPL